MAHESSVTTDPGRFVLPDESDLRQLRLICGLDAVEVAERGGWETSTIRRWETGEHSPSLNNLRQLLDIYRGEMNGQQQLS